MIGQLVPDRVDVMGLPISLTSYQQVIDLLQRPPGDRAFTVAVCNVHSVMSSRRDPVVLSAIADADVATPDGQPVVWAIRALYEPSQTRVYGPDLLRMAAAVKGIRHFMYGATEHTLDLLESALLEMNPEMEIVGRHAPPFRSLTDTEIGADAERIRASGATVVWVGLGMPKQEVWMRQIRDQLPGCSLVGVGAAFDIVSGRVQQAPPLIQKIGLEWAFRLVQEPQRLWRRYVWNNPAYLLLLGHRLVTKRRSRS